MAVNANGEMAGSIGGGIMEHKFVEMAKAKLQELGFKVQGENKSNQQTILKKQVHDKEAAENQSGMICSGEQTNLLYLIKQADALHIQNIVASLSDHKNGTLELSPSGLRFNEITPLQDFEFTMMSTTEWTYKEKTGYKNQLFIIGGGHCALALSRLVSSMDFYIRLFEDRDELNTLEHNAFVHEKIVVEDYAQLATLIPSGVNHYVVIMTVGYRTDYTALKALLEKDFKYIGVLGSKKKMEKLFAGFQQEHAEKERLNRVHTPIGISINSHTPEEIAVSIAAEMIMVKNK